VVLIAEESFTFSIRATTPGGYAAVHILRLTVRASSSEREVSIKLSQCAIYRLAIWHRVQPVGLVWRNASSASNWSWRSVNLARWSRRFDVMCSRAHSISSASSASGIAWYGRSGTLDVWVIAAGHVAEVRTDSGPDQHGKQG